MLVILTLVLLSQKSFCIDESQTLFKEISAYHNKTAMQAAFAQEVVDIMYNSFHQTYFTVTFCEFTYFENRLLKYTETWKYGYNVRLLNGCSNLNKSIVKPIYNKHGHTTYLVTSNNLSVKATDSVIDVFKRTGIFRPRSAVIFVIKKPIKPDKYFSNALKKHFELLWNRCITKSVLILKSDSLRMYTYNPFLQELKDITGNKQVAYLLRKQNYNLYGYKLRLSVFRKVFMTDKTGPVLCESNLAKTVINFINASCIPLTPRDDSTVGDLLENGTATGITADLMDKYSDLELNSRILKNTFYGYIDTTYPYFQDELCFLVKKSGTQSAFDTTVRLITGNLLILFFSTFVIFILITVSAWKIEKMVMISIDKNTVGETIMNLIKCFIRQTVDFVFRGPVFRFLVLLIIVYSLIIDCAIDGIITTAITYPHYKPDIITLNELAYSNLTLGIHNRDLNIFNKSLNADVYEQIKNRIELINDEKIKQVLDSRNFKYALLLRKTDASYISRKPSNMENGRPLFDVVPDCPLPCFIVYGLSYGSPYLPRLNYILQQLSQGGIIQYWARLEESNAHRKLLTVSTKGKKALSLTSLEEVFYVLLIGEAISTLVFIIELLIYSFKRNKK